MSRVNGVGSVDAYGSQYSMRIWLDPNKLTNYQMTTQDVVTAIKSQNAQIAVGQLGGTPPVIGAQEIILLCPHFNVCHIPQRHQGAILIHSQRDVFELLRRLQERLRVDGGV